MKIRNSICCYFGWVWQILRRAGLSNLAGIFNWHFLFSHCTPCGFFTNTWNQQCIKNSCGFKHWLHLKRFQPPLSEQGCPSSWIKLFRLKSFYSDKKFPNLYLNIFYRTHKPQYHSSELCTTSLSKFKKSAAFFVFASSLKHPAQIMFWPSVTHLNAHTYTRRRITYKRRRLTHKCTHVHT